MDNLSIRGSNSASKAMFGYSWASIITITIILLFLRSIERKRAGRNGGAMDPRFRM